MKDLLRTVRIRSGIKINKRVKDCNNYHEVSQLNELVQTHSELDGSVSLSESLDLQVQELFWLKVLYPSKSQSDPYP